ncbi:hypothetical protein EYF80_065568 [Liparis tanakae]|uniref:Uncharacterized protein n=1 Tax=Liparis tanakae TaxID=230148 RepID=A0A4Z2E6D3_9TELE|nr:hypothetical protein EYF80_065568 [Liparis tanakae]
MLQTWLCPRAALISCLKQAVSSTHSTDVIPVTGMLEGELERGSSWLEARRSIYELTVAENVPSVLQRRSKRPIILRTTCSSKPWTCSTPPRRAASLGHGGARLVNNQGSLSLR